MTGQLTETAAWPATRPPADFTLSHVRVVLADRVVDDGTIVVRDGLIAEILERPSRCDLDGQGLLVMPGLIDIHSDALEKERAPRPTAVLPWDFTLTSFEQKLAALGITTMFHGAGFQHKHARGVRREPTMALDLCREVVAHRRHAVDHRILHRLDVLSEPGADALRTWLAERPDNGVPPLVSHEDHTPGQGQYVDPQHLVNYIVGVDGSTTEEAWRRVEEMRQEGTDFAHIRQENLTWLGELASSGQIRLMGHDPDTPEAIDELVERGAVVAEFPTTMDAARRARERGLLIAAGAPNVLRGRSHAGNVSAGELARAGCLDAVASDYLPSGMLGAVSVLAPELGLPRAVGLVTSGPARVAGLADRGVLAEGERADLVLVDDHCGPWLRVATMLGAAG
ncbi:alpha-D-ribose 1-methylphosphonate 5-triphosphate diphosphatase [Naumannella sp. ID2617S]|uniref:Alpha-D-ribose 1-methylphosphonate 5-triphosphate diphosphatase n=1 Tax=Enemella dayhoffiae TaxID=2016507 RepID=A0A255HFC3_9ACTN|nr:alpha-D-ribose 1-methylphosphonate 5-triphosphate diphosphatase [Enemella dayhoffiae]NNG19823.1 alpha-D-ribose 1-methylphosphonate 5-triphosphate diphosphatase [Naumannella sp. ID2617S]OYO25074.1 alpha-D-ribose 1-methylphosphonate 5-triphosphate diphosphatase [Enemella dayhoffiae]